MKELIDIESINCFKDKPTAVALGNFDGLHKGHIKLLSAIKKYADENNMTSVFFSFSPHPITYFKKTDFKTLTTHEEQSFILNKMGIDFFIKYPFYEETANMEADVFARDILFGKLNCKYLAVGEDYRFGRAKKGNVALLKEIGKEYDAEIISIPIEKYDDKKISSTEIRSLVKKGNVAKANALLSSPYFVMGNIIKEERSVENSCYIIEITPYENKLLPKSEHYFTVTHINDKSYRSVTFINIDKERKNYTLTTDVFDFDNNETSKDNIYIEFYDIIQW